jgi:hypothetical protein
VEIIKSQQKQKKNHLYNPTFGATIENSSKKMEKIATPITTTTPPNENKENNNNMIIHTNTPTLKLANSDSNSNDVEANNYENEKSTPVQSETSLRPLFKKSNTCGSLYARCACKVGDSKRKLVQSYSHPDTTIIFTDANKYACNIETNRHQTHVISARNGEQVEISHSAKRFSSPNIDYNIADCVAVHPEILVKKTNSFKEQSAHKITRSILKKASKSFPGFSTRPSHLMLQFSLDETVNYEDDQPDSLDNCEANTTNIKSFYVVDDVLDNYYPTSPSAGVATSSISLSDDQNNKNNLEYLKYSALSYQKEIQLDQAESFFKESGILGPMGGGVSNLLKKSSRIAPVTSPTKDKVNKLILF